MYTNFIIYYRYISNRCLVYIMRIVIIYNILYYSDCERNQLLLYILVYFSFINTCTYPVAFSKLRYGYLLQRVNK